MPLFKIPIHLSYILYLAEYSPRIALGYFNLGLGLCRLLRVEPSILLHPLDFMGCDDEKDLAFFPAMGRSCSQKLVIARQVIDRLVSRYQVVTMAEHASAARQRLWAAAPTIGKRINEDSATAINPQ